VLSEAPQFPGRINATFVADFHIDFKATFVEVGVSGGRGIRTPDPLHVIGLGTVRLHSAEFTVVAAVVAAVVSFDFTPDPHRPAPKRRVELLPEGSVPPNRVNLYRHSQ
jgi:hypothetical protein